MDIGDLRALYSDGELEATRLSTEMFAKNLPQNRGRPQCSFVAFQQQIDYKHSRTWLVRMLRLQQRNISLAEPLLGLSVRGMY